MRIANRTLLAATLFTPLSLTAATATLLGWNNLGMHCMDSDYSVFSVLPPYNTAEAQLIVNGSLVTNSAGYTVTYQAVADPDGSFNSTAMGKGNFYTYVQALYGANPPAEMGLAGWAMPGPTNLPQSMLFEPTNRPAPGVATPVNWWRAEGIPLSPYNDAHVKNPYPLMRLIAWNSLNQSVATNDIVLPVSDEMDCRACHASGTRGSAEPVGGWVWDGLPERDFRLNILRLHDEIEFSDHYALYTAALAARGFNPQGLYRGVLADGKPVLCAACHASEALGAPSYGTIPPLTASMHWFHAFVVDPVLNTPLDNVANRTACYRCHPGSATRCLRGAMGAAVAADGTMQMQCQSCHGTMSQVGSANRVGWFMEPNCQACHTGTAVTNRGQIRFTSAFTNAYASLRTPADSTFATQPNTPAPGLSLYRFSAGHGGLQCSACHGSTHAEFPSTHRNDNLRNIALQGYAGVMAECTACHTNSPTTIAGGPHGMHPVGDNWLSIHDYYLLVGQATFEQCQPCHGTDYRGTVLSRMQADRLLTEPGPQLLYRGAIIGCYNCHNGPFDGTIIPGTAPVVTAITTNTTNDKSVAMILPATGTGLTLRIISQPASGSLGLSNNVATYFPSPGFVGTDTFTYAAYDGTRNSSLATGAVTVAQGPFSIGVAARVPPSYPATWAVAFAAVPAVTNSVAPVTYDWDFGDSTPHSPAQFPNHAYATAGIYHWTVTATVSGVPASTGGNIAIGAPIMLKLAVANNFCTLSWSNTLADTLLESSTNLGPSAQWHWETAIPAATPFNISVTLPAAGQKFYRVRRPW